MIKLNIAKNLSLPTDAVTQTFALLGKRGVGKTHTAVVIVEEMLVNQLPVCVVDPIGVWWGLRSSKNGKSAGFQIIIFGGDNGDVPLQPGSGKLIADLIVNERIQCVLDLSLFSKAQTSTFMTDFCERLYRKNREPLQLVLDEADAFAPQRPQANQARMLGAVDDIVRRGRARGLGVMLATQRPAVLNKNVLTQIEVLIALRTVAPNDRKALEDWINAHGTPEQHAQLMKSLPSLPIGTAWFWSPGWLDIFKKVMVRDRKTFDSSATPKMGQSAKRPKSTAEIDLSEIREHMSDVIADAAANDPKELKRQVAKLKRENESLTTKCDRLQARVDSMKVKPTEQTKKLAATVSSTVDDSSIKALEKIKRIVDKEFPAAQPNTSANAKAAATNVVSTDNLSKAERKILFAFYWLESETATPAKVGFLAGYSHKSGSFSNSCSKLRTKGLLNDWAITPEGVTRAIDEGAGERPTGTDNREWLRSKLSKCENAILDEAINHHPDRIDLDTVAAETGYSSRSGSFSNALSKLRTIEAIYGFAKDGGIVASDSLV